MQQIVYKIEFSILFDAIKTENVQYLEEKLQSIKKLVIEKIRKKIAANFNFNKSRSIFQKISLHVLTLYTGYLYTKFGINRASRFGVSLYTDRQIQKFTISSFFYY